MKNYSPFCIVVDKSDDFRGLNFEKKSKDIYYKGAFLSSAIIGNIYSYQKEKGINELEKGIIENASSFLKDFVGDFSFVFLGESDSTSRSAVAARDHMGVFPLYYYSDEKMLVIANDQRLMIDIPGIDLTKNDQWIADYVNNMKGEEQHTFYVNIKKVPAAHFLRFENQQILIEKYWELDITKRLPLKSDDEYIREFRALLQEAVECRIPLDEKVGSEVSGGIDCTGIASIAKSYLDKHQRELYTYAHAAMDDNNPSEKKPIEKYLTYLKPHKHTFIPLEMKGMKATAHPTLLLRNGVSKSHYSLFSRDIYRAAQLDQVKVVLSGNGGDHCVSYKAVVLVIQQLITEKEFLKAWKELKLLHGSSIKGAWKFFTAILNMFMESPFREKKSEIISRSIAQNHDWLKANYPESAKYPAEKEIPSQVFYPVRKLMHQRLYRGDLQERSEHTTIAASEFGVLYRYPLLDVRLMQYMVSLPTHLYYHNKMNRYIYREAIKEWVPLYLAQQPKPPGNMYGWITEAYDYDNKYPSEPLTFSNDEELKFYFSWWDRRSQYTKNTSH